MAEVVIIGAGLAGLSCARTLHENGVSVQILEKSDGVGGRVRTDEVDGFLLDRGFQVMLTAYPEAKAKLDYNALDLKPFLPGALVRHNGAFHRIGDPFRRPQDLLPTLAAPVGSIFDKGIVLRMRLETTQGNPDDLFDRPEVTSEIALRERYGFSQEMIDRFFRPFYGGIFLRRDLQTSSRMLEYTFRMFSEGDTVVPAGGIQRIPEQIASHLPDGVVRTEAEVAAVDGLTVKLASGEAVVAEKAVVVATEGTVAAQLLEGVDAPESVSVTCLYFAAPDAPVTEPVLMLDGEGTGPVNNFHVASAVAPNYASNGEALLSASVLGDPDSSDDDLEAAVRAQMTGWFGAQVDSWRHLRTYRIQHAQPGQNPPALQQQHRSVKLTDTLYVCGDHRDTASINGAMVSGRRTAEAILAGA